MIFLPDTNVFINAFKGIEPDASFLSSHIRKKEIIISVIVLAEFKTKSTIEQQRLFDKLVKALGIVGIDEKVASMAGEYRKKLVKKSKRILLLDCFLAAQAKIHNFTLATNNRSDFPMRDIKIILP